MINQMFNVLNQYIDYKEKKHFRQFNLYYVF